MLRRPQYRIAAWIAAGVVLSAAAAYLAARLGSGSHDHGAAETGGGDLHAWMHKHLKISEEQHALLDPFEEDFEKERKMLLEEIGIAGKELAAAIRESDNGSPPVEQALLRLNRAQGELQKITLDHFFVMKEHLDPEQAERLLQWTHDSITGQHHE